MKKMLIIGARTKDDPGKIPCLAVAADSTGQLRYNW